MVTVESFLDWVPAIGVIIALAYYTLVIRNQNRTRQAQLYMQFLNPFLSGKITNVWDKLLKWEYSDREEFEEKYWSKPENRDDWRSLTMYFEGLGVYVKEGLIPIRLIALTMTTLVIRFWDKFSPIILEYRVNTPRNLSETEYLYDELMRYLEEHPELKP
jgi:hypothetical protein